MPTHLAECHWMPKAGLINERNTLLRFSGVVGDEGSKTRRRRMDEEHFINHGTTLRGGRIIVILQEGWEIIISRTREERIKHFEFSA